MGLKSAQEAREHQVIPFPNVTDDDHRRDNVAYSACRASVVFQLPPVDDAVRHRRIESMANRYVLDRHPTCRLDEDQLHLRFAIESDDLESRDFMHGVCRRLAVALGGQGSPVPYTANINFSSKAVELLEADQQKNYWPDGEGR